MIEKRSKRRRTFLGRVVEMHVFMGDAGASATGNAQAPLRT
ncbi:hypothetical protein ACFONL_22735 [Camelimonas fluminis]|uniref:Uncharacterized protein n=1 Tax=Camelimonas fluminis TaxID=1576911 RepID=A0ABV7UN61_9HYPH|nr:hypothetical protein [Camelimonas fluminis]